MTTSEESFRSIFRSLAVIEGELENIRVVNLRVLSGADLTDLLRVADEEGELVRHVRRLKAQLDAHVQL